jgi:uncharacterized RDD family membrane protein YckC
MKEEAHKILKACITRHRDIMLSGRQTCLGIFMDYGGRHNPEVKLLSQAVEHNIPDRLIRSQPVTPYIIESLSVEFAANNPCDNNSAIFVVSSWADALGLLPMEQSIIAKSGQLDESNMVSNAQIPIHAINWDLYYQDDLRKFFQYSDIKEDNNWYYYDGLTTHGPFTESVLRALCENGALHSFCQVWKEGMNEWRDIGTCFVIATRQEVEAVDHTPVSFSADVRPWTRLFARSIDIILFGIVLRLISAIFVPSLLHMHDTIISFVLFFLYVFVEPFLISKWGFTPGKWLLMVRVRNLDGSTPSYTVALERSFNVWIKGLGAGIPLISVFTQTFSYFDLKKKGVTSWDKDRFSVTHGKIAELKIHIVVIIILIFIVLTVNS